MSNPTDECDIEETLPTSFFLYDLRMRRFSKTGLIPIAYYSIFLDPSITVVGMILLPMSDPPDERDIEEALSTVSL